MTLREKYPDENIKNIYSFIYEHDRILWHSLKYDDFIDCGLFMIEDDDRDKDVSGMDYEVYLKRMALWKLQNL